MKNQIKLEYGKRYVRGNGTITSELVESGNRIHPFKADMLYHTINGCWCENESPFDIVRECDEMDEIAERLTPEGWEFMGREDSFSDEDLEFDVYDYKYSWDNDGALELGIENAMCENCYQGSPYFYWYRKLKDQPELELEVNEAEQIRKHFFDWVEGRGVHIDCSRKMDVYSTFCAILGEVNKGV